MDEIDIWRAAQQMIKQHADAAVMEASMRADAALDQGDIFNFELWKRVAKVVQELERQNPKEGEVIN